MAEHQLGEESLLHLFLKNISQELAMIYGSKLSETQHVAESLRQPRYTVSDAKESVTALTYRLVNLYEGQGLISPARDKETTGWRRLSVFDLLRLRIITELKKFGLGTRPIRQAMKSLWDTDDFIPGFPMCQAETYLIIALATHERQSLLVFQDGEAVVGRSKTFVELLIVPETGGERFLHLPFTSIVFETLQPLVPNLRIDVASMELNEQLILDARTLRILEVIRNGNYESIRITKSDGSQLKLVVTSRKRPKFSNDEVMDIIRSGEARKVVVNTLDGKEIVLTIEDTVKL